MAEEPRKPLDDAKKRNRTAAKLDKDGGGPKRSNTKRQKTDDAVSTPPPPKDSTTVIVPSRLRNLVGVDAAPLEKLAAEKETEVSDLSDKIEKLARCAEHVGSIHPGAAELLFERPDDPYILEPDPVYQAKTERCTAFYGGPKHLLHHSWAEFDLDNVYSELTRDGKIVTRATAYQYIVECIRTKTMQLIHQGGDPPDFHKAIFDSPSFQRIKNLVTQHRKVEDAGYAAKRKARCGRRIERAIGNTITLDVPEAAWNIFFGLIRNVTDRSKKKEKTACVITSITIPVGSDQQLVVKRDRNGRYADAGTHLLLTDARSDSAHVRGVVTPKGKGFMSRYLPDSEEPWKVFDGAVDALRYMGKCLTTVPPCEYFETIGKLRGQCAICGKNLTDAQSKARGVGPDCYALLLKNLH